MSEHLQTKINYAFVDEQLLRLALRSAHRDKDDKEKDDGNRGLAHYGILAVQMAETHNAIMERGKTLYDLNTQNHWSKTKKGRAMACRSLGIEPFIERSVRQQYQTPSDTVLDYAMSAILGAVWLDCEGQGKTASATRHKIWEVLRSIDAFIESSSLRVSHSERVTLESPSEKPGIGEPILGETLGDIGYFAEAWFVQEFDNIPHEQSPHEGLVSQSREDQNQTSDPAVAHSLPRRCSEPDTMSGVEQLSTCDKPGIWPDEDQSQHVSHDRGSLIHCASEPRSTNEATITTAGCRNKKRKRVKTNDEKINSTYHTMLTWEHHKLRWISQDAKPNFIRFLEHPTINESEKKFPSWLRFLYLAIGSWPTIHDYIHRLRQSRSDSGVCKPPSNSRWGAVETYNEICRLEKEEDLSVLRRRYHTMMLCGNEQESYRGYGYMMVETPETVGEVRRSNAGNPVLARDASLTNNILSRIMPGIHPGSIEFERARRKVKQLRKLARCLYALAGDYGLGILALLPSGSSFGESSLTDGMLLSIPETTFNDFATLLFREQGPLLQNLSRFVESSLLALVTDSLGNNTVYPIECIDTTNLQDTPKGLLDLSRW